MRFVERSGKTIEDAVTSALEYLRVSRDKVEVEVIQEPSNGLFGILGSKLAVVKVTVKEKTPKEVAEKFLLDIISSMNIKLSLKFREENSNLYVTLEGEDVGVLIGRRGQTLDSLQYLVNLVVNKSSEKYVRVFVDSQNYREKREDTLERLAKRLAAKVISTRKSITLEPMNPYERRIIHSALQNNPRVETYSEGEDPYRKIVISLK